MRNTQGKGGSGDHAHMDGEPALSRQPRVLHPWERRGNPQEGQLLMLIVVVGLLVGIGLVLALSAG